MRAQNHASLSPQDPEHTSTPWGESITKTVSKFVKYQSANEIKYSKPTGDDSHVRISGERVKALGQHHVPQKHARLCDLPTHLKQSSTDPVTSSASSLGSLPAILPILKKKSNVSICQHHQPIEGPLGVSREIVLPSREGQSG